MLKVENLNQHYGSSHTLRDVSFDLQLGACTTLLGRNGVGKTTLLKCLMGLLPVSSGSVAFEGEDITRLSPYLRARRGIAYVPQGREIFPRLSVEENLLMGMATDKRGKPQDIPFSVFEMFPVLKQMLRRRGGDLSGGQQQQLAIARALVMKPKVLVLDEPTEGIQPSIIKDIERVIRMLSERGDMAILLVEQYFEFAQTLADQFLVLRRGEIVRRGARSDMHAEELRQYLVA
ncbi:MAG: urea ABC transporter ATP-binding subunit UrtE [Betaproteobacteria bacterium]